jgi:hypothetical protein
MKGSISNNFVHEEALVPKFGKNQENQLAIIMM